MKLKIAFGFIFAAFALSVVLVAGCKHPVTDDKTAIANFLDEFNSQAQNGNTDSLQRYFETGNNKKSIDLLIKVLSGKTNLGGKTAPLFKTLLNTSQSTISTTANGLLQADVPANFVADGIQAKSSDISFVIRRLSDGSFRIISVNADGFKKDYLAYQRKVSNRLTPSKNVYEPITLAAFKNADKLKTRYDSVLWFEHINTHTYYYVIKGKLNDHFYWAPTDAPPQKPTYKMGLVNPTLREIIPPIYDLVHNIGGTIDDMIEVEKDDKRGLYNTEGTLVVPVDYDQIYPLKEDETGNLALLKKGADYFYLTQEQNIEKQTDLKIADVLPKIKTFGSSYQLSDKSSKNIMEYNDRESTTCLLIPPSYLVDWKIVPKLIDFQSPLRKHVNEDEESEGDVSMAISFDGTQKQENSWLESAYYSVVDEYLGARAGLYTTKKLLVVDKKQNRLIGFSADTYFGGAESGGQLSGECNENTFRAINDSLFEFKTTSNLAQPGMIEGPYYHYLQIKDGKLVALPGGRIFNCTKYVKIDDSYLRGCYVLDIANDERNPKTKTVNELPDEWLEYMKNEIYASYGYQFKSGKWAQAFSRRYEQSGSSKKINIDDSLTTIDKFNIKFLVNKINSRHKIKTTTLAAQ